MIPKIFMDKDAVCEIKNLKVCHKDEDGELSGAVLQDHENCAKVALMLFCPHRSLQDLDHDGSHWLKFVRVGALEPPNQGSSESEDEVGIRTQTQLWKKGEKFCTTFKHTRQSNLK